jgi:hypothetical protein
MLMDIDGIINFPDPPAAIKYYNLNTDIFIFFPKYPMIT